MVEGRGEKNKDEELWGGSWKSCQECLQLRPTLAMARLQFQTFPTQSSLEECKLFALRRDAIRGIHPIRHVYLFICSNNAVFLSLSESQIMTGLVLRRNSLLWSPYQ